MAVREFQPSGWVETMIAALLRALLRLLLKPVFSPRCPIAFQRRWLAGLSRLTLLPRGARFESDSVGGVRGEWNRPAGPPSGVATSRGTLLYLHGGAYCLGSPATHRNLTARLARLTGLALFSLDYRLAPEHPFPAAVQDAVAACRALMAAGPVVIAGDSAGGGLALATALALRDAGHPQPAALVLLSPWVDMSLAQAPQEPARGEAMLSVDWARACAALTLGAAPATHPWASPLGAELRGLPPVLIQAGTDELLHAEALRLHDALQTAAVPVSCEITCGRWHVFQAHAGALRSADEALRRVAEFVAQTLQAHTAAAAAAGQPARHEVVILGAGMSGLCMAIQLKKSGMHDFVILEQSSGLGGTWWDNRYPGAHVDVPAPLYCFSFEPNPNWTRRFAAAGEIQVYMQHCAERYGLARHLRLGTRISQARFDEAQGRWHIGCADGNEYDARFFVCSTGPLSQARWPDLPGLERFSGPRLHSAQWDASVPLQGRRVAVIGTGSTASQLVPPIAEQAAQLLVFQRTANWILPRLDRPYHALDRALARWPPYSKAVRAFWYGLVEWGRHGFDEGTRARRHMLRLARRGLQHHIADEALRAKLTPPYPLGCKRLIYSNDFYRALAQPHVELVTEGIREITPQGIVTADGRERAIDVLVCATGFDTTQLLSSLQVQGRGGRTLREAWQDGPEAYRGVTVSGFPNLLLLLGPNTGTGHTSTLLYIEAQVQFCLAAMRRVHEQGARSIEVRDEVFRQHNAALQARLAGSVWSHCRSWYRTDSGKIVALWPGFTREYVQGLQRPDWGEYVLAGASAP